MSGNMKEYVDSINERKMGDLRSYTFGEMLGCGSYGKVYEVFRDGKRYAMKMPLNADPNTKMRDISKDVVNSFKKEAAHWAELSDKCPDSVVVMSDYNIEPFPWVVMEYADCSFCRHIDSEEATVGDIIDLLTKLQRVHDAGIIHGDIKPENIMLVDGEWKFTDFGISMSFGTMSNTLAGVGSQEYMSPEKTSPRRHGQIDQTSDLWAMGVILFRILAGRSPYDAKEPLQLMQEILLDGPNISLAPVEYSDIFKKVFSTDKTGRYQFAFELVEALEKVMGGDRPISVPEPPGPKQSDIISLSVSNDGIGEYNGMTFRLINSELHLIKYSGLWRDVAIPASFMINGVSVPVTVIENEVFRNYNEITSIVIPDSVTDIGNFVFSGCSSLKSIVISESVNTYGTDILGGCVNLSMIGPSSDKMSDIRTAGPMLRKYGFTVPHMVKLGFSLKELYDMGYTPSELLESYSFSELIDIGAKRKEFNDELIGTVITKEMIDNVELKKLIEIGFTCNDFGRMGYSIMKLKEVHYSVDVLKSAGYSASQLRGAGYDSLEELKSAGYSVLELKSAGYSALELKNAGFQGRQLRQCFELRYLYAAGYKANDLKIVLSDSSLFYEELMRAGYTSSDLKSAGYSSSDVDRYYFKVKDEIYKSNSKDVYRLLQLYSPVVLIREKRWDIIPTCNAYELKLCGISADQLRYHVSVTEMAEAGYSAKELKEAGCSAKELKYLGYSAKELKKAGCSAKELKDLGYSAKELMDAVYSVYSAKELKDLGYSAKELKEAGCSAKEMKKAGYSVKELDDAGYSISELIDAHYQFDELKQFGYTLKVLKEKGFSYRELMKIGFTKEELKEAGFKGLFL